MRVERWADDWQAHIQDPLLPRGRVSSHHTIQLLLIQQFESGKP